MSKNNDKKAALNGAMAGLVSAILLQPLEVLKVNLILLPDALKSVKGKNFLQSFKESSGIIY